MDDRDAPLSPLSDVDRALAAALEVEVSPEFAARVRRRIANEPMRAPFWHGWRIVVTAAAAALVVAVAGFAVMSNRGASTPHVIAARPLSIDVLPPAEAGPGRATVRVAAASVPVARARVPPVTSSVPSEPEVLVPREEIEMYRRLIAAAQNVPGAVVVEAPTDIVASQSITNITIDPIKIDLIVPPVSGEGDRQ